MEALLINYSLFCAPNIQQHQLSQRLNNMVTERHYNDHHRGIINLFSCEITEKVKVLKTSTQLLAGAASLPTKRGNLVDSSLMT